METDLLVKPWFTEQARKVMQFADQEARSFNHEHVGTEHILLGLVKEGSGLSGHVLDRLGLDLRTARLEVEKLVPAGQDTRARGTPPLTPRAKKAIEYALEEARALDHTELGAEHLLLGLLCERDGVAAQILSDRGVGLEELRHELSGFLARAVVLARDAPDSAPAVSRPAPIAGLFNRFTGQARRAMLLAHREAHRFGHDYLGTEHVLLGVLQEGSGAVACLLTALAVDTEQIRTLLEKTLHQGAATTVGDCLPLTPPARRALHFALEEAARLHHAAVGPEHLLLGLLHEPEGEACQVLLALGLDLERLREGVLMLPPPENRDAMLQAEPRLGAPAVAADPTARDVEGLISEGVVTPPATSTRRVPSATPLFTEPGAAGLALQLRITQLVLGGLAGLVVGAMLYGRPGGFMGLLAGVAVAAVRNTPLGILGGVAAGLVVGTRHAATSPLLQILSVLAGLLIGCCLSDVLQGFAPVPPRPAGNREPRAESQEPDSPGS